MRVKQHRLEPWIWLGVAFTAGCAMITGESLWIDEGQTLRFAAQPTFADFAHELARSHKSEAQMPLGLFTAWLGVKLIGTSEWQLRAPNVLWLVLTSLAAGLIGRITQQRGFWLAMILWPFTWYYVNEARPYAMQLCAGTWVLYLILRIELADAIQTRRLAWLAIVCVAGFATHALFGFVVFGAAVALLPKFPRMRVQLAGREFLVVAGAAVALMLLAGYYAWTIKRGDAGARLWPVGLPNVAFAAYELLGFGGLGPPRAEIREAAHNVSTLWRGFLHPAYAGVAVLACAYLLVIVAVFRARRDLFVRTALVALVAGAGALLAAARLAHFPFWGRHAAGLLPLCAFVVWRAASIGLPGMLRPATIGVLVMCLVVSTARQRLDPWYGKDDYRCAAATAATALAHHFVVWWSADPELAPYYRVPTRTGQAGDRSAAWIAIHESDSTLETPAADVIIAGKADVWDEHGALARLTASRYVPIGAVPGFVFWAARGSDAALVMPGLICQRP